MDSIQIILFVLIIIGIVLVVFSLISLTKNNKNTITEVNADDTINAIDTSILEADKAISELSDLSSSIFKDVDDKYQELLFLYSMIDEKKKDIVDSYNKSNPKEIVSLDSTLNDISVNSTSSELSIEINKRSNGFTNPKFVQILQLKNLGFSVSEIAKKLNIGQGEVELIFNLERKGDFK